MKIYAKAAFLLALLGPGCWLAAGGGTEPGGLASGLKRHYKLSSSTLGANGYPHLVPGTVLTVQKEGIVSFADDEASYVGLCSSDVQDGAVRAPKSAICNRLAPPGRRILKVSETVCITALGLDEKGDTISMSLTTCSRKGQARKAGAYHALVRFRFPRGALTAASADEVASVIGQALSEGEGAPPAVALGIDPTRGAGMAPIPPPPAPDDSADRSGVESPHPPAQGAGPDSKDAAKPAPSRIAKGQSTDQVVAILGPPRSIADLGAKLIYYYPNFKVVFVNGKVSEIQSI